MGFQLIQPSFTGGELSPSLYGRVDIARYQTSVRTARNLIVRPYGGLTNRPGFQFIGETKDSGVRSRLIPFVFSTGIAYVIELGDRYARFWANGAPITVGDTPVELVTPWAADQVSAVAYTQSADVMILCHPAHPPQRLRRLSAASFDLGVFETREGPFSDLNTDESRTMAASGVDGVVTITANDDVFLPEHADALIYLEAKDLSKVRPWIQGDREVTAGQLRRSEGKTYRAVTVPPLPGSGTVKWVETGPVRPIHEQGRVWDGPGTARTDGTNSWVTGIEWEYVDAGYGIAKILTVVNTRIVTAVVQKRLPASVVGGVGVPDDSWSFIGDGTTKNFAITGATSNSALDFRVNINGVPVQSDPYYVPGVGGGYSGQPSNLEGVFQVIA